MGPKDELSKEELESVVNNSLPSRMGRGIANAGRSMKQPLIYVGLAIALGTALIGGWHLYNKYILNRTVVRQESVMEITQDIDGSYLIRNKSESVQRYTPRQMNKMMKWYIEEQARNNRGLVPLPKHQASDRDRI